MARKVTQRVSDILKKQDLASTQGLVAIVGALRERHDSDDLRMAWRCLVEFERTLARELEALGEIPPAGA